MFGISIKAIHKIILEGRVRMNRIWQTFSALTAIDSPSHRERELCDNLKERLAALGIETYEDGAGAQIGGNCGNLYGYLGGSVPLPPLLFCAHMDTVAPGLGKKAVLGADGVITSEGDTILGADDAAGITIILEALSRLKESGKPHRPAELLFTVAEEVYGLGSAKAEFGRLQAKEAYTLDLSGAIGEAANAAPTLLTFTVKIIGKAAHAGFAPADGVHAIAAASRAIARIPLGEPAPGVTVNVGRVEGGIAPNIVPPECTVTGEIRSLSHDAVMTWWDKVRGIFEEEAESAGALTAAEYGCDIVAYETPIDSAVVRRFVKACEIAGVPADVHPTLGGSDQNVFATHGIQGIVLACSIHNAHSVKEFCRLDEMEKCVELVLALLTL
jgi:tripeptide aminopeptidase